MADAGEKTQVKHKILVFSKLDSFTTAKDKVQKQIEGIVAERVGYFQHGVEVVNCNQNESLYVANLRTATAVVVIDARQTRTLVTPYRRDPNVDHWSELDMLYRNKTKPKGSILLVIYGDEMSKNLDSRQLLADQWKSVWKYNDERASCLADKNRCFSIWDKFNDFQKSTIQEYLEALVAVPMYDSSDAVLVCGENEEQSIEKYLKTHPFISNVVDTVTEEVSGTRIQQFYYLSFDEDVQKDKSLTIHYCHDSVLEPCDEQKVKGACPKIPKRKYSQCILLCDEVKYQEYQRDRLVGITNVIEILKGKGLETTGLRIGCIPFFSCKNKLEFIKARLLPSLKSTIDNLKGKEEHFLDLQTEDRVFELYGLNTLHPVSISAVSCNQGVALCSMSEDANSAVLKFLEKILQRRKQATEGKCKDGMSYNIHEFIGLMVFEFVFQNQDAKDTNREIVRREDITKQQILAGTLRKWVMSDRKLHVIICVQKGDTSTEILKVEDIQSIKIPLFHITIPEGTPNAAGKGDGSLSTAQGAGQFICDFDSEDNETNDNVHAFYTILSMAKEYMYSSKASK
ncbi:uncharacterized protein LOC144444971 [Glandiceps talaboti]